MIKRYAHKLKPNEASTRPEHMIFVDTETEIMPAGHGFKEYPLLLGQACYWRRRRDNGKDYRDWWLFRSPNSFWSWLDSRVWPKTVTYLISHNLTFDMATLNFMEELPKRGWELKFSHDGQHTALYVWRKNGATLYMMDNRNLFRGDLAEWGRIVEPARQPPFPPKDDPVRQAANCKRGVEILIKLWERWLQYLDVHDMGTFKPTIASQAMAAWRHRFMDHPVYVHNNEDVLKLEREAYRGGRTECYQMGRHTNGPFYKLDVNSMYPFCMWAYEYPNDLRHRETDPCMFYLEASLKRYGLIARVELEVDEPWFPVTAWGRNVYPVGRFKTVLTTRELELALRRGWIKNVYEYARYAMRPLFRRYVNYFYPQKVAFDQEGAFLERAAIKMMLNSLHGKLAQRGRSEEVIGECDLDVARTELCYNPGTNETYTIRRLAGKVTRVKKSGESFHSMPGVAAHISADARLKLYALVKEAGREHTYYIDTDCLIVDRRGYLRLLDRIHPSELGALKVEGVADRIEIRAPKDYSFGDIDKIKGIPQDAEWETDCRARFDMWPGMATMLNWQQLNPYKTREMTRTLSRKIVGGRVGGHGVVHPLRWPRDREE